MGTQNFFFGNITLVFWFSDRQERWSGSDRHVYLINVTADQPLSENSIARGGVGGGLIVIRYSNTCSKSSRTISLNSEGMLRGTDNFYFILITFSFKLELVLINRVINIFLTGYPYNLFACHQWYKIRCLFHQNLLFMPHCTEWKLYLECLF